MNDDSTRSNDASGDGIASPNPCTNATATPAWAALRVARSSAFGSGSSADHVHCGYCCFNITGERAGAAADVEHAQPGLQMGLRDQLAQRCRRAEQTRQRIVERQPTIVSGRRNE